MKKGSAYDCIKLKKILVKEYVKLLQRKSININAYII